MANYKSKFKGQQIDNLLDFVNNNQNNIAMQSDLPTDVSDLNNDSGFIDNTVNNLVNYYLKSETYTKTEINTLVNDAASGGFVKVETLPTENINAKAIYLVPYTGSKAKNLYDEYIYIDGDWEMIGTTKLDLSNYVTVQALNTALADYVKTVNLDSLTGLKVAMKSSYNVGGITAGTTLPAGMTFNQFVKKLFVKDIPTINFSISQNSAAYGESCSVILTVNISDLGTAKEIRTIAWYGKSSLGTTHYFTTVVENSNPGSWSYTRVSITDTTSFKANIGYYADSNNTYTEIDTGFINTITFYHNKFYGAVSDANPTEATVKVLSTALGNTKAGTYSFTVNAGRICYAYPKSLGTLTSIKDGNGFNLLNSFTRTEQTYTQNGASVEYYRYILTDPTTISNYSITFA